MANSTAADASTSGITADHLSTLLTTSLSATHVAITDMSGGCGQMYEAVVVSPLFEGKNRLARHRMVNQAVKEEIKVIHAWTPRCLTVREWEKEQAAGGR